MSKTVGFGRQTWQLLFYNYYRAISFQVINIKPAFVIWPRYDDVCIYWTNQQRESRNYNINYRWLLLIHYYVFLILFFFSFFLTCQTTQLANPRIPPIQSMRKAHLFQPTDNISIKPTITSLHPASSEVYN